jgi:hypothetical protein
MFVGYISGVYKKTVINDPEIPNFPVKLMAEANPFNTGVSEINIYIYI